ncbi:sugar transporter [Ophiostoma piceae UAMH 11346]|uniref:Sugar transporter n=1 Tax=Ophiostoma piceae (strain UAMH 11346) TaxID=1262450 RepID=S3CSZ2_OPHP1|nr:sugar transporter [Ophiostoma piceae UAMH 11346]
MDSKTPDDMAKTERMLTNGSVLNGKVEAVADSQAIDTHVATPGINIAYEKKIAIMNQALIDIGMGPFQWKMQFWMQAITVISTPVRNEFNVKRIAFLTVGKYAGLVVGSSMWPMTADFIGRRLAFNVTLLLSAVAGLVGAGSPNFPAIATFAAFIGIGTGGNQPVDSAIFLEFIPATHQYLLTMQSAFWSVGQTLAVLIGWPLIANFSCPSIRPAGQECRYQDNMGWRYVFWTCGGLTLVMYILRLFFHIYETPKFLLGKGLDAQAVAVVHNIAERNKTTTWLTVAHFEAVDAELRGSSEKSEHQSVTPDGNVIQRTLEQFKPEKILTLFSTPKLAMSTCLLLFLWCAIGMAYPLYNSFIPIYLENKGVKQGNGSLDRTYRNYAIQAVCGIPASILGGFAVDLEKFGRKGTGSLACIATGVFLFLYTRASSSAGVLGFSCAVAFFQNLVYGVLYSYTPELFPAPVRGTANGLVALANRLSGLMAPIIVAYVNVDTSIPIWISAALFVCSGVVFLLLPYETRGKASA